MKALLLPFLFLFSVNLLNGQIPFASVGAKYHFQTQCPPYSPPPSYFAEITTDSIIQGKYCTLVDIGYNTTCNDYGAFVHSDGYQVFVYDESEETFHLLYDFSKDAGELYKIKMCENFFATDSATVEIEHVSLYAYNGMQAVRQELKVRPDNDSTAFWVSFNASIYEGIGGYRANILLVPELFLTTDCFTEILCYWSPTTGAVGLAGVVQPCIPVNSKNIKSNNYFSIFPNPANRKAIIEYELPINYKDLTVYVFNSTGQLENKIKLENNFGKTEIGNLLTGIYFITMTSGGRVVGSEKLIVLK